MIQPHEEQVIQSFAVEISLAPLFRVVLHIILEQCPQVIAPPIEFQPAFALQEDDEQQAVEETLRVKAFPFARPVECCRNDRFGLFEYPAVFAEELVVQFGGVQRLFPGMLQFAEIGKAIGAPQFLRRKIEQDLDVGAVRAGARNVLDQGHFFEHIPACVPPARAPGDDGQADRVPMFEDQHHWHGEQLVDRVRDARQILPRICCAFELDCEEQAGLDQRRIRLFVDEQTFLAPERGADLFACDLEEQIHGFPLVQSCVRFQLFVRVEHRLETLGGVGRDS